MSNDKTGKENEPEKRYQPVLTFQIHNPGH